MTERNNLYTVYCTYYVNFTYNLNTLQCNIVFIPEKESSSVFDLNSCYALWQLLQLCMQVCACEYLLCKFPEFHPVHERCASS